MRIVVSGDSRFDPREELAGGARADVGRGRVVRVAVEHQPGAFRPLRELLEIDLELGIERHGPDRVAHHLRVARAFLVGRDRADERPVLGGEEMRGRPQDLRRSAAEHDVLRLDAVLLRDGVDQRRRAAPEYRPGAAPVGPNAALTASSTVLPGPSGFSLLDRTDRSPGSTACSVGSNADHRLFSRPRAPMKELVTAPAAPMPTVWTNPRRVSDGFSYRLSPAGADVVVLPQHVAEHRPSAPSSRPSCRSRSGSASSRTAGSRAPPSRRTSRRRPGNPSPGD